MLCVYEIKRNIYSEKNIYIVNRESERDLKIVDSMLKTLREF